MSSHHGPEVLLEERMSDKVFPPLQQSLLPVLLLEIVRFSLELLVAAPVADTRVSYYSWGEDGRLSWCEEIDGWVCVGGEYSVLHPKDHP